MLMLACEIMNEREFHMNKNLNIGEQVILKVTYNLSSNTHVSKIRHMNTD